MQLALAPKNRQAMTVTGLISLLGQALDQEVGVVWVRGEVGGLTVSRLGHAYFSLKDASSQIQCVAFKSTLARLKFRMGDGVELLLRGKIGIYAPKGGLQLIVEFAEPIGAGSLQEEFEKLKRKLHAAGLFDPARKRRLPYLPQRIAVITSPTGAAIRDVLSIFARRNPALKISIVPAPVQGFGAGVELAKALSFADEHAHADVLLLTRGGGSAEDLSCFNDEALAYAIANCKTPVVSAVGHEIDFSIADFVADVRAATPSAAAELITPVRSELVLQVASLVGRLEHAKRSFFERRAMLLQNLEARLHRRSPERRLADGAQRLDELSSRLERAIRQQLQKKVLQQRHLKQRLLQPGPQAHLERAATRLERLSKSLHLSMERKLERLRSKLEPAQLALQAFNPLSVLERGFSVTRLQDKILTDASLLQEGDTVNVQLARGSFTAIVQGIPPSKEIQT